MCLMFHKLFMGKHLVQEQVGGLGDMLADLQVSPSFSQAIQMGTP